MVDKWVRVGERIIMTVKKRKEKKNMQIEKDPSKHANYFLNIHDI
jgi:hypothetical protein